MKENVSGCFFLNTVYKLRRQQFGLICCYVIIALVTYVGNRFRRLVRTIVLQMGSQTTPYTIPVSDSHVQMAS